MTGTDGESVYEIWCGNCEWKCEARGADEMEMKASSHMLANSHTNINIVERTDINRNTEREK